MVIARTCAFLLLSGLLASTVRANDEARNYARSVVTALGWANEAARAFDQLSESNTVEAKIDFLYANKVARDNYEKARSEVLPFVNSRNELLAKSAGAFATTFEAYSKMCSDWEHLQHDLATAEGEMRVGKVANPPAAMAAFQERTAELKFRADKLGEMLGTAASGASWTVYEVDSAGKPQYPLRYAFSADERRALVRDLVHTFGKSVAAGPKPGQSYLEVSAAVLIKVLTQGETTSAAAKKKQ